MANFNVMASSEAVRHLWILAIESDYEKELVADNIDDLESVFSELQDETTGAKFSFFADTDEVSVKVEYEDGAEFNGDSDNCFAVKPLTPREEFDGDDNDYEYELDNHEDLKKLKFYEEYYGGCEPPVAEAIKKAVKGTDKNFLENLILAVTKKYDKNTKFLLCSVTTNFEWYLTEIEDEEERDDKNDEVFFLNVEDSELNIGDFEFHADRLADHVIYKDTVYGHTEETENETYYIDDMQFQLIDANLNPVEL